VSEPTLYVDADSFHTSTVPEARDGITCEDAGKDDRNAAADDDAHDGVVGAAPLALNEEAEILVEEAELDEYETRVVHDDGDVQHLEDHVVVLGRDVNGVLA
jgi:hypothetical protein